LQFNLTNVCEDRVREIHKRALPFKEELEGGDGREVLSIRPTFATSLGFIFTSPSTNRQNYFPLFCEILEWT
jgi:hypothetical protein